VEILVRQRLLLIAAAYLTAGVCANAQEQAAAFRETAKSINATIRANHYRPAELDSDVYRRIEKDVTGLGESAASADEFITGFNALWRTGPFSHVSLRKAEESTADRYARLDTEIAGDGAVSLAWQGSAAILTVNNLSGVDTI
jgi:carboxyl-terminal processing protease